MPIKDLMDEVRGAVAPTSKDYQDAGVLESTQQDNPLQVQTGAPVPEESTLSKFRRGQQDSIGLETSVNTTLVDAYKELDEEADAAAKGDHETMMDTGRPTRAWHALKGTTTGYIASAVYHNLTGNTVAQDMQEAEGVVLDDPSLREPVDAEFINELFYEHGMPYNERYDKQLRKAEDKLDALRTFQRLQDHAESARIASYSPLLNFAVQVVDPAENLALAGATMVTGGFGAPAALSARSLSMFGKLTGTARRTTQAAQVGGTTAAETLTAGGVRALGWSRAGAQAGALGGTMALGAASGRETTAIDYITAGALITASRYYFGPERQLVKRGLDRAVQVGDARAVSELAVPSARIVEPVAPVQYIKFTPLDDVKAARMRAQALAEAIPQPVKPTRQQALRDAAMTPELRAVARKAELAERALPVLRRRVQAAKEAAAELPALRKTLRDTPVPTRRSLPKRPPKHMSARAMVRKAREEHAVKVADLEARIQDLERTAETLGSAEAAVHGAEASVRASKRLDRIAKGEYTATERAAGNALFKERMDTYAVEAHSVAAQRREALADIRPLDEPSIQQLENIEQASLSPALREETQLQEVVEATGATGTEVKSGRLRVPMQAFRGIVSEFERLTLGHANVRRKLSALLDDPLMRDGFQGRNAAAFLRQYRNVLHGHLMKWETALDDYTRTLTGESKWKSLNGFSSRHETQRLAVEKEIAQHLLDRNAAVRLGDTPPVHPNEGIRNLTRIYEEANAATLDIAKKAGLEGAENIQHAAGYFHRSYSYDKFRYVVNHHGEGALKKLLTQSVTRGLGVEEKYAELVADAIFTRTMNKGTDARTDFMGQLGKVETASIIETLETAKVPREVVQHIEKRIGQKKEAATGTKYLQDRLPLDMQARIITADGTGLGMSDLIDMDLSRLLENTVHGMAGRSALAKSGIGGTDSALEKFRQEYIAELNAAGASTSQIQDANKYLNYIYGEFTGIRPDDSVLSSATSTVMSLASASFLGSTGLLQIAETPIIMNRYGMVNTMKAIMQRTPGVKQALEAIGANKDLAEEFASVVGIDLSRDMRVRSWKRQVEVGQTATAWHNRIAYMMQQATPTITGQRAVHKAQAGIIINLGMHRVIKAANGDAKELAEVLRYMPELDGATLLGEVKKATRYNKAGAVSDFGWSQLSEQALDDLTNVVTRMADDAVLHGRVGQGASFNRSAVGQVLFQFMSYSSYAHNKLLRGTYHDKGAIGVASLFVHQYPLMFAMTYLNEVRRGNIPDLDNDADLKHVATRALSYSAALGLFDLGFSVVGGGRGGVSAMDVLGSGGSLLQVPGALADGEAMRALGLTADTAAGMTFLGAIPGAQAAIDAAKD